MPSVNETLSTEALAERSVALLSGTVATMVTVLLAHVRRAEGAAYYRHAAVPAFMLLAVSALSLPLVLGQGGYDGN